MAYYQVIESEGECLNENVMRLTHKVLSLIYDCYNKKWEIEVAAASAKSRKTEKLYKEKKESMPPGITPAEIMKAVTKDYHEEILDAAILDSPVDAPVEVAFTEVYDQSVVVHYTPVVVSSTPKALADILRHQYKNGILWCSGDIGNVANVTAVVISSFAVCTSLVFGSSHYCKERTQEGLELWAMLCNAD